MNEHIPTYDELQELDYQIIGKYFHHHLDPEDDRTLHWEDEIGHEYGLHFSELPAELVAALTEDHE